MENASEAQTEKNIHTYIHINTNVIVVVRKNKSFVGATRDVRKYVTAIFSVFAKFGLLSVYLNSFQCYSASLY